jgi:hypothetical protein
LRPHIEEDDMPVVLLTPRERELLLRPVRGSGEAADLLRKMQARIDRKWDELEISGLDAQAVRRLARDWRHGLEAQFQAVITAMERIR